MSDEDSGDDSDTMSSSRSILTIIGCLLSSLLFLTLELLSDMRLKTSALSSNLTFPLGLHSSNSRLA